MFRSLALFLLLLFRSAGIGTGAPEVRVTLVPRPFPDGFRPAFSRPLRVPLAREAPPVEGMKLPEGTGGTPWFGLLPRGDPPGLLLLLVITGDGTTRKAALYLDRNRNHDLGDDGSPAEGDGSRGNGGTWGFIPRVELETPDLRGAFRFTVSGGEKGPGHGLLYTESFMAGEATLPGSGAGRVFLLDEDGDGRYTRRDRWALLPPQSGKEGPDLPRTLADLHLLTEAIRLDPWGTWHVAVLDPGGRSLSLAPGPIPAPPDAARSPPRPCLRPRAEFPVPWLSDRRAALARAKGEHKPLLVVLTAPGGTLGRALLEGSFQDLDVAELAAAFVPLHVEVDDPAVRKLPFQAPGLPCVVVLDEKGRVLRRFPGYRPPERLVRDLESVIP